MRRYSLGIKIDNTFSDIIELVSMAQFSPIADREKILTKAITKNDVLKFLLYTLKELNGIDTNKFIEISTKTEEVGKMLYGWKNQSIKQNNHS